MSSMRLARVEAIAMAHQSGIMRSKATPTQERIVPATTTIERALMR